MGGWLTLVVLAVLAGFALIGYQKGMIKMVVSVFSVVITFVLVMTFQPRLSEMLCETSVYDSLYQQTYEKVYEKINEERMEGNIDSTNTVESLVEALNLPESMNSFISRNLAEEGLTTYLDDAADKIIEKIAVQLTTAILNLLVFIVSYIVILAAVKLLMAVINLISYLPVIHGMNKLAGLAIGLLEGLCVVWLLFLLITVFGSAEFNTTVFMQIQNNALLAFLYEHNVIMNFILK
jgi:uncharacterized membrane protein required for colicin V production